MSKTVKEYKKNYVHSAYQEAIFNYIKNERGNLMIEASAGAGKTYTIIKSLEFIPSDKSILLAAFNKDIVNELEKRASNFKNTTSMTMHRLGYKIIRKVFGNECDLDELKYVTHIKRNVKSYSNAYNNLTTKNKAKFINNVRNYVDFGRFYLCANESDLDFIEERYDIETIGDEKEVALKVMEWGKENVSKVDYTDMVWIPNTLNLPTNGFQYDYIMVDECQDMNRAERELIFKCCKEGTRLCSCGDKNQCLYAFSGSDPDSFDALCSVPNTVKLPLSISYRCAKNIIKLAQTIVPTIEEFDKNEDGEVVRDSKLSDLKDGDMVLCRNNAPLIEAYMELLNMGKKAFIRGKEMGLKMKSYVNSFKIDVINSHSYKDGLENRMYNDLIKDMYEMMENYGLDETSALTSSKLLPKLDMIMTICGMCKGLTTTDELIKMINDIFGNNDDGEGIALSTIHKAKGLEAENVYILCEELMPSKSAKKDWERTQEKNLIYVAYTRAKKKLGFLKEDRFNNSNPYSEISKSFIKSKERICEQLYGTSTKISVTKDNAKEIAYKAQSYDKHDLSVSNRKGNVKSLSDVMENNDTDSINSLLDYRKKRRRK